MFLKTSLDEWQDNQFENVLKGLLKLTNPKGGYGCSLAVALLGFNQKREMSFVCIGQFYHGKHSVIGYYENGEEFVYNESIYLLEIKNLYNIENLLNNGNR